MMLARLALTLVLGLGACRSASSTAFDRGADAARAGDWDEAVRFFERAVAEAPGDVEFRMALSRAYLEAARAHLHEARAKAATGEIEAAIDGLETSLEYDPTNRYARAELAELREERQRSSPASVVERVSPLARTEPVLDPDSADLLHIEFPEGSSLENVLESLGKLAGINILFDESFRDKRVAVDLRAVSYREALDILMVTNGLFYKTMRSSIVVGK